MALANVPAALIQHILSFVRESKNCTRKSRATLVQEVLTTCSIFDTSVDKRQCIDDALRQHTESCRQCTISFSKFRYQVSQKTLYCKFNMRIGFPTENHQWYTNKLHEFCKYLNEEMLLAIADKPDENAFSPQEYDVTGDNGEELGHGRMPHETYHYPAQTQNRYVVFSCLFYLTRVKADYVVFSNQKKQKLEERATRTQQIIQQTFSQQMIMQKLGEYLKQEMCNGVLVDCSYEIQSNFLRLRGFER